MLEQLQVLLLELLAGSLETIDLLQLLLLLLQSLADDVARLGIGLVADVVGILLSLGNDGVRRLLSSDEGRGNLTLGGAHARRLLHRRGRGDRLGLRVRKLVLSIGELLLGRRQAILEIDDLGKHRVDLGSELLEEDIDLSGIVAALGLGKRLSLNVGGCDCHEHSFSSHAGPCPACA